MGELCAMQPSGFVPGEENIFEHEIESEQRF